MKASSVSKNSDENVSVLRIYFFALLEVLVAVNQDGIKKKTILVKAHLLTLDLAVIIIIIEHVFRWLIYLTLSIKYLVIAIIISD